MEDRADEVAIVVPVLRRAHRVAPFLSSLSAATSIPHRVDFVATAGDSAMIAEIVRLAEDDPSIVLHVLAPNAVGDYAKKCNHAYRQSSTPFLFLGADDLDFRPGWLEAALAEMADPAAGVVGTQDLAPTDRARNGEHATHVLVRRRYVEEFGTIDEPGKILHEGYPHEYVDDELVETAKMRGAWRFAHGSVVEHLHPSWGKAPRDALYNAQRRRMEAGRRVFVRRRQLWAPTQSR
jgi:hypothetical protein